MADHGGDEKSGHRRPHDGDPDDLFVWEELRPPRRDGEVRPPRPLPQPKRPEEADHRRPRDAAAAPADAGLDDEWSEWLEPGEGAQRGAPVAGGGPGGPFGPDAFVPRPGQRGGPRRRRASAAAVLAAMLIGFFVAGLLDAKAIETQVKGKPLGTGRSMELALLKPMVLLSGALRLDRPAESIDAMLGRGQEQHHSLAEVRTKVKPKWPRKITRRDPLRLYIIGDSMAQVFGSSLENLAEATHLIKAKLDYKVSSGLSRPDFFDWPQRMVDQIVEYDPDATAVLFGANDGQNFFFKGKVLKVGSKAWQDVYQKRVGKAMTILTRGGRRAYWVGNPIMRDAGYRDRIAMMDHLYEAEAQNHPGVTYISTWKLMADEKGSYAEYLREAGGDPVLMRAPDGIHLSRAGGDRMAQAVLDVIERDWGMPAQQK
jgi:uncharacterized protein